MTLDGFIHLSITVARNGFVIAVVSLSPTLSEAQDLNKSPLWMHFEKLFCAGEQYYSCSLDSGLDCKQTTSGLKATVNFKERRIEYHGKYRDKESIVTTVFSNHLNPSQSIILGDGRVLVLAHYKFESGLEIKGQLVGGENVAYSEPKERIVKGIDMHTLTCHPD